MPPAAALTLILALAPQAPDPTLVEAAHGLTISTSEYRAWLHQTIGGSRLADMLLDRILALETADLTPDADLATILDDPDTATRRAIAGRIAADHGGDAEAYGRSLAELGRTPADAFATHRLTLLRETRIAALVRATRVPTEAALRRAFEDAHGRDGVRTDAWHVLIAFPDVRRRLEAGRRGRPLSEQAVRDVARQEAERITLRARNAGGLEALGPQRVAYGFERFAGAGFEAAVRTLEPGQVSDPVESRFGFHVVEVLARRVTSYADVASAVREAWMRAPPTLPEQRSLRELLFTKYRVEDALRARSSR